MPAGRPKGSGSRYHRKYCRLLIEYFERMARAKTRRLAPIVTKQEGGGKDGKGGFQKQEVRRICAELPTVEGFAVSVKIPSSTIKGWVADYPEFRDAYTRAKDIQRQLLVDRGLTRQYDPQAFQFVAKNITDMTDKQVLAGDPAGGPAIQLVVMPAGAQPPSGE